MTINKIGYSVPKNMISPTEWALMLSALPVGYKLTGRAGRKVFVYTDGGGETLVATACMVEGEVIFEANDDNYGQWFIRKLKDKYPEANPERILWAVFIEVYEKWSLIGQPTGDREEAIKQVSYLHLEKNPTLCSFRAIDFSDEGVLTITSQRIMEDWQVTNVDEGPQLLLMTNLESAALSEFMRPVDYLDRLE